jgi:hypothetical protein
MYLPVSRSNAAEQVPRSRLIGYIAGFPHESVWGARHGSRPLRSGHRHSLCFRASQTSMCRDLKRAWVMNQNGSLEPVSPDVLEQARDLLARISLLEPAAPPLVERATQRDAAQRVRIRLDSSEWHDLASSRKVMGIPVPQPARIISDHEDIVVLADVVLAIPEHLFVAGAQSMAAKLLSLGGGAASPDAPVRPFPFHDSGVEDLDEPPEPKPGSMFGNSVSRGDALNIWSAAAGALPGGDHSALLAKFRSDPSTLVLSAKDSGEGDEDRDDDMDDDMEDEEGGKGSSGGQASRKDRGIEALCINLFALYGKGYFGDVILSELTESLNVPRRRIYDVVNILEALGIMSRKEKDCYIWHGTAQLPIVLERLKARALQDQSMLLPCQEDDRSRTPPGIHPMNTACVVRPGSNAVVAAFRPSRAEELAVQAAENDLGDVEELVAAAGETCLSTADNSLLVNASEAAREAALASIRAAAVSSTGKFPELAWGAGGAPPRLTAGKKSMGCLAQKFVMFFLVGHPIVSLERVASIFLGSGVKPSEKKFKSKVRRLYDIANVLQSLSLVHKVQLSSQSSSRKPAFAWRGVGAVPLFPGASRESCVLGPAGGVFHATSNRARSSSRRAQSVSRSSSVASMGSTSRGGSGEHVTRRGRACRRPARGEDFVVGHEAEVEEEEELEEKENLPSEGPPPALSPQRSTLARAPEPHRQWEAHQSLHSASYQASVRRLSLPPSDTAPAVPFSPQRPFDAPPSSWGLQAPFDPLHPEHSDSEDDGVAERVSGRGSRGSYSLLEAGPPPLVASAPLTAPHAFPQGIAGRGAHRVSVPIASPPVHIPVSIARPDWLSPGEMPSVSRVSVWHPANHFGVPLPLLGAEEPKAKNCRIRDTRRLVSTSVPGDVRNPKRQRDNEEDEGDNDDDYDQENAAKRLEMHSPGEALFCGVRDGEDFPLLLTPPNSAKQQQYDPKYRLTEGRTLVGQPASAMSHRYSGRNHEWEADGVRSISDDLLRASDIGLDQSGSTQLGCSGMSDRSLHSNHEFEDLIEQAGVTLPRAAFARQVEEPALHMEDLQL